MQVRETAEDGVGWLRCVQLKGEGVKIRGCTCFATHLTCDLLVKNVGFVWFLALWLLLLIVARAIEQDVLRKTSSHIEDGPNCIIQGVVKGFLKPNLPSANLHLVCYLAKTNFLTT
jgi:hypothetical protein